MEQSDVVSKKLSRNEYEGINMDLNYAYLNSLYSGTPIEKESKTQAIYYEGVYDGMIHILQLLDYPFNISLAGGSVRLDPTCIG